MSEQYGIHYEAHERFNNWSPSKLAIMQEFETFSWIRHNIIDVFFLLVFFFLMLLRSRIQSAVFHVR